MSRLSSTAAIKVVAEARPQVLHVDVVFLESSVAFEPGGLLYTGSDCPLDVVGLHVEGQHCQGVSIGGEVCWSTPRAWKRCSLQVVVFTLSQGPTLGFPGTPPGHFCAGTARRRHSGGLLVED